MTSDCTAVEIVRAYKKQAIKWHPDNHENATDEEKIFVLYRFKSINHAGSILRCPEARRHYDAEARSQFLKYTMGDRPDMTLADATRLFVSLFVHLIKVRYEEESRNSRIRVPKFAASLTTPLLSGISGFDLSFLQSAICTLIRDDGRGDIFGGHTAAQRLMLCKAAVLIMGDEK